MTKIRYSTHYKNYMYRIKPYKKTTMDDIAVKTFSAASEYEKIEHLSQQIIDLKDKLRKLREML